MPICTCFSSHQPHNYLLSVYSLSVLQISYAFSSLPSSPHSNHLQMVPSEEHLAEGVISLLNFYGWERLVLLSEDFPVFRSVSVGS